MSSASDNWNRLFQLIPILVMEQEVVIGGEYGTNIVNIIKMTIYRCKVNKSHWYIYI